MLHTAEFPFPGSQAVHAGELVEIRQHLGADMALVFYGKHGSKRVPLSDLAPPPAKTLFERWREERLIEPKLGEVRTPASEVCADYVAWLNANGASPEHFPPSPLAFDRLMHAAGHAVTVGPWARPGDRYHRNRRLYALALRGVA